MKFRDKFILGTWNIGIVDGSLEELFARPERMKIRWMRHHYRDRYFADPFLQDQDRKYYYFLAEEYNFWEARGKISRLTVEKDGMKLVNREVILNETHHVSFPFLFQDWILPEAYQSGAFYAYQPLTGGEGCRRIKICSEPLVDPVLLVRDEQYWLFATTRYTAADSIKKLSIFHGDEFGSFAPHEKNPVKIDCKTARPAGRFFTRQGRLYRPVMDSEAFYGHQVRIMEVTKLSAAEFEEREVMVLSSRDNPPYNQGFHTFNVYEDCIVVDGYREYYSYFLKPCFVKLNKVWKFLNLEQGNQGKKILPE